MAKDIIVIGNGGHAKVLLDALYLNKQSIIGFTEQQSEGKKDISGLPLLGNDEIILSKDPDEILLVIGIGSITVTEKRKRIYERFAQKGYEFASVLHPSAIVSKNALLGEGVQIMAGAILQNGCYIGNNTIINTRAAIDHDCHIGNHVHIAPGVILSGGVYVGDNSHIGTGAVVIQGIKIGSNVMVAAGSVVVRDIPDGRSVRGNPARQVGQA